MQSVEEHKLTAKSNQNNSSALNNKGGGPADGGISPGLHGGRVDRPASKNLGGT